MDIWTMEQEAEGLRKRFANMNRAEFAREHRFKGGESYIYQHITGRRPISLEAALVYASAFKCDLKEISPRWALEVKKANENMRSDLPATKNKLTETPRIGAESVEVGAAFEYLDDQNQKNAVITILISFGVLEIVQPETSLQAYSSGEADLLNQSEGKIRATRKRNQDSNLQKQRHDKNSGRNPREGS